MLRFCWESDSKLLATGDVVMDGENFACLNFLNKGGTIEICSLRSFLYFLSEHFLITLEIHANLLRHFHSPQQNFFNIILMLRCLSII